MNQRGELERHTDRVARVEWEAWQEICKLLRETNAVTEADMQTPVSKPATTPGLKLLAAIRAWGDAMPALHADNQKRAG